MMAMKISLQYTGTHERLDMSEAFYLWTKMDALLEGMGWKDKSSREFTHDGDYSSTECLGATGILWPFSETASAVLRDQEVREFTAPISSATLADRDPWEDVMGILDEPEDDFDY